MLKKLIATVGCAAALSLLPGAVSAETLEQRVREAALTGWIHGINQELADSQVGPEGVPILLDLLEDPEFPRKDNVVAFLAYLALDSETLELVAALDDPSISDERPEDHRARLLVPEALGRIAARGGTLAQVALEELAGRPTEDAPRGFSDMIAYGQDLAAGDAPQGDVSPTEPGEDPGFSPNALDTNPSINRLFINFANHVDTNNPISLSQVEALWQSASVTIGTDNGSDVACCIEFQNFGDGAVFGSPGDGLDVITTSGELSQVLSDNVARVKVVDLIQYCGGPGSNILGCAPLGGFGIAVVRGGSPFEEGLIWSHELGHNTSLPHNASTGFIMTSFIASNHTRVTQSECNSYHNPSAAAQIPNSVPGVCQDDDGDGVVSSIDNCPDDSNNNQSDVDNDGLGNVCDNCATFPNPDQADCDEDGFGDVCDGTNDPPPTAVQDVQWPSKTQFVWDPEPYSKKVFRGFIFLPGPWPFNEVQIGTVSEGSNTWNEGATPAPNQLLYYLVKTFNGCGDGP